jgi:hypothetical protein
MQHKPLQLTAAATAGGEAASAGLAAAAAANSNSRVSSSRRCSARHYGFTAAATAGEEVRGLAAGLAAAAAAATIAAAAAGLAAAGTAAKTTATCDQQQKYVFSRSPQTVTNAISPPYVKFSSKKPRHARNHLCLFNQKPEVSPSLQGLSVTRLIRSVAISFVQTKKVCFNMCFGISCRSSKSLYLTPPTERVLWLTFLTILQEFPCIAEVCS